MIILLILQLCVVAVWFTLCFRLFASEREVRMLFRDHGGEDSVVVGILRPAVQDMFRGGQLMEHECGGALGEPVPDREPHDPYRDLRGLLVFLMDGSQQSGLSGLENWIKALLQLQEVLGLPQAVVERCLDAQIGREGAVGIEVASYELISPGGLIDRGRMWPMGPGTRVLRPLGVVLFNGEGRVISKAKVLVR